jgi:tRNA modification GTPase
MTDHLSPDTDTIVAIASAPGRGGIGIIRLSGSSARLIGQSVCRKTLRPRYAHHCSFFEDGASAALDSGIALYFSAPRSFTGEDVVELQAHGGPVILDLLAQACCRLGARLARPGEFSERAYLNNKLDLAQAEAIADLINSTTESAARSAHHTLQGAFSEAVNSLVANVTSLRVYVEAAIDFPEEEIDFLADGGIAEKLSALMEELEVVLDTARQGSLLRDGMKLVIAGKPNAGKSSLLNALTGQDSAIVTPIEGTTRDVLREHIEIDGMPLHVVDTAGLRSSEDPVEKEGIRRAWQEMETADGVLLVVDSSNPQDLAADARTLWPEISEKLGSKVPVTLIHNKCDLLNLPVDQTSRGNSTVISLSAKLGTGIDLLRQHLKNSMGFQENHSGQFSARRRHLDALHRARDSLVAGRAQLEAAAAGELLAEDLRQCQQQLGEITGAVSSDALLGEIFSSFCIGK